MINLLPKDYKKSIAYARRNTFLRGWISALAFAVFGGLLIIGGGYLYMDHLIKKESKQVEAAKTQLSLEGINETRAHLDDISANVKLSLQVLSREVLFSSLIRQLGSAMPSDTALTEIQIEKPSGGITIKAVAKDIDSATQIQVNLADPSNKIFEKADIETIKCDPPAAPASGTSAPEINLTYPCNVQLKALFAKDNPFLYISGTSEKTP